jgi:hypothetical protein
LSSMDQGSSTEFAELTARAITASEPRRARTPLRRMVALPSRIRRRYASFQTPDKQLLTEQDDLRRTFAGQGAKLDCLLEEAFALVRVGITRDRR